MILDLRLLSRTQSIHFRLLEPMANPAAMADEVEDKRPTWRSRIAGFVLTSLILILMGLVNLPYRYVETQSEWIGMTEIEDAGSAQMYQATPTMAGWPLRYSVQYDHIDGRQSRFWSTSRLVGNLGITLALGVIVYAYIQLRYRYIHTARNQKLARSMFDVGIALAILLAPALVMASQYRIANQHRRLGHQMVRNGNVQLSAWLPEAIVNHVPNRMMPAFARIRQVFIRQANDDLVRTVAEVPTLIGLSSYRGSFETSALQPLRDNINLCALELNGRTLNDDDIELIAGLRWLAVLKLPRTNLDADMLRRLDQLPLRHVALNYTPLKLSELGFPGWSETVEELYLTRPAQGVAASLTIEGWPRLRRLSVSRSTSKMNPSVFKIKLVNLPNLMYLRLDRLQKHDCVFRDLPRWYALDEGLSILRFMLRFDEHVPGLMWLSNLVVDGVASIERIGCFAHDLESISIRNAPNVRTLTIGSFYSTPMGDIKLYPADPNRCQTWINQVGSGDGPTTVDFTALPLAGLNLSALANNDRIRHLKLGISGITYQQVQQLSGMEQLESLDIRSCPLEQDQLSWLLQHFPKLKHLNIDGTSLTRFDLMASEQLRSISMTPLEDVEDVRIVDLPALRTRVRLLCTPQLMEIRNAPSLQGLSIEAPWPKNAAVSGLRDLEWFAGGGETIDDSLMDVILNCRELDQLTLAYTSITPQKLREIGRLDRLSLLALPGAPIDDSITANWHNLTSLWEVNFDDTSVSDATIAWLSKIES